MHFSANFSPAPPSFNDQINTSGQSRLLSIPKLYSDIIWLHHLFPNISSQQQKLQRFVLFSLCAGWKHCCAPNSSGGTRSSFSTIKLITHAFGRGRQTAALYYHRRSRRRLHGGHVPGTFHIRALCPPHFLQLLQPFHSLETWKRFFSEPPLNAPWAGGARRSQAEPGTVVIWITQMSTHLF